MSPVLLVVHDSIPPAVAAELRRLKPIQIDLLDGLNTVSQRVVDALRAYRRPGTHG